ncbi:MAG: hypothetical protein ACXVY3_07675 [Gaiellaceae bacterium]
MKRFLPAVLAALLAGGLLSFSGTGARPATAALRDTPACGLPATPPLWIDYADSSVPFGQAIFGRPGIIAASARIPTAAALRQAGAQTIYFDLYLKDKVGTTVKPADPATIAARADKLFNSAVASSGCSTPYIAENELFGSNLPTPWTEKNAQYRANVLALLQRLHDKGAHPFLLISKAPYTDGDAGDWWRKVAAVSDLVPEVYFNARNLYKQGAILASRNVRTAFRQAITNFTSTDIPLSKLGIMLGFQTGTGVGGREGLQPKEAWFRTVKWQALAAKQVAKELPVGSIWSWGWGAWSDAARDPDKQAAACVYLWTRTPSLCDGPAMAGSAFDTSLSEGQITLPAGTTCAVDSTVIKSSGVSALQRLTHDPDVALSVLYARAIESEALVPSPAQVAAVEQAIVSLRFGGSYARYGQALTRAGATRTLARAAIADQLRRSILRGGFKVAAPSTADVMSFYESYADVLARPVQVRPAAPWLGGSPSGYALQSLAPDAVFKQPAGVTKQVTTPLGLFSVKASGPATPLGALPLPLVSKAVAVALRGFAQGEAFTNWSLGKQLAGLSRTACVNDDMPSPNSVELISYLPFLSIS